MKKPIRCRKSIRLHKYDYSSSGMYFVTICVQHHKCIFGKIIDGKMILSKYGEMVERQWYSITERFYCVSLDAFIIMPNHMHGIIQITHRPEKKFDEKLYNERSILLPTVGNIVGAFKSLCVRQCLQYIKKMK